MTDRFEQWRWQPDRALRLTTFEMHTGDEGRNALLIDPEDPLGKGFNFR